MRDKILTIGITEHTKHKIEKIAKKYNYSQVTVLEYLLHQKLGLDELDD